MKDQAVVRTEELKEARKIRAQSVEVARQLDIFLTFMYYTSREDFLMSLKKFNDQSDEAEIILIPVEGEDREAVRIRFKE